MSKNSKYSSNPLASSNKKTICLNMIVKNEEHIIVDTLKNLSSYINFDYWVISDTGSTDNTKKLICDFFNEKKIKGELVEHEWQDFAYNRTKALECALNKTDYLFIFDADDSIHGNFKLPQIYQVDKYQIKFGPNFIYTRPLLVTNRKKWCFKGVLHETLHAVDEMNGELVLNGDYHVVSGRLGNRSKNPNKYYDDAIVLKNAFEKEFKTDYTMACRYAFYCAQSYKDSGPKYFDESITWYKKVLELDNWLQEKYYSCWMIGNMYLQKQDANNALTYLFKSLEYDPERVEGLVTAVNVLRNSNQHVFVNALYYKYRNYPKPNVLLHKLFLLEDSFNDELEYHTSISSFYINDKVTGYACCKQIINNGKISFPLLKSSVGNMMFYKDLLLEDSTINLEFFYKVDNIVAKVGQMVGEAVDPKIFECWEILFGKLRAHLTRYSKFNHTNADKPKIFLSFTTCKRFDLFKQTINSILNHWTDIQLVDYWFCVDDNSTEDDRKKMKLSYPWIKYHMKGQDEKGHRQSMNIIWNKLKELKPTYWIHMEDDFLFHYKTNYITEAINGLKELSTMGVGQILFNRNYGEVIKDYIVIGHIPTKCQDIVLHDFKITPTTYPNCHYWPHYSFRPSVTDVKTILKLGNYDSANQFFEADYAKKWTIGGNKSAFFNRLTNRHIGRLTSDKDTKVVKNAYDLNGEEQFQNTHATKDKKVDDISVVEKKESIAMEITEKVPIEFNNKSIKIVNLERRLDRKNETIKKLTDVGIMSDKYEFINAVDGQSLQPTLELKQIFEGNDFGSRRGFIGCAMSHYNLWKQLLLDDKNEYYIIMEDDFTLCDDFKNRYTALLDSSAFIQRELLFMGYSMFTEERNKLLNIYNNFENTVSEIAPLNIKLYIGGFFCYSINKVGAHKMIDYISANGIKHGIDYLIKIMPNLECYESQPQLTFAVWNEAGKNIDTDIQQDFIGIDFSKIYNTIDSVDIAEQFIFKPELDINGNDLYYHKLPVNECMRIALNDTNCVGFNTLGFFKNKIDTFVTSKYFGPNDGVYIKKEYYNKLNSTTSVSKNKDPNITYVKMLCNWTTSEQLCKEWSNMCDNVELFRWKNIQMTWSNDNDEIDYYVIINSPPSNAYFDPKKTIIFQMEPWVDDPSKNWGVKTWGEWARPDPSKFLSVRGRKTSHHNNAFWQLEVTYTQLINLSEYMQTNNINKMNKCASICSSKYFDEGHIVRIDLLKYIENKLVGSCNENMCIDIYNQDNNHQFKNYKGALSPYIDKSKGVLPYKYYFMIENNYEDGFITEKIWEPILCESLCFYYGCPNISEYIDPRAYVLLDINDFEKSYQIIIQAISEDWWTQRIDIIRKEKQRILNELFFFPVIEKIISDNNCISKYNTYFSNIPSITTRVPKYCFIHSCHLKNSGLSILIKLLTCICEDNENNSNNNLLQHLEKIFIINIGDKIDDNIGNNYKIFNNNKIQLINYSENTQLFEIDTINLIHTFCENINSDCEILYLHTKGISWPNHENIVNWTEMMVYFLAEQHTTCDKLLKSYDAIGCNYSIKPHPHFSGNFWWATSKYIKTLPKIKSNIRHDAEWWILSNTSVNNYELHNSGINHYHEKYPKERYYKYRSVIS
jgi:GR25 family glycosyltransferase involved in LPS biosynthesis